MGLAWESLLSICLRSSVVWRLLRWHSGEESACQYRRHKRWRFALWVGKGNKKWQPTPVFLPEKFHARRNLVTVHGVSELDTTEHTAWEGLRRSLFMSPPRDCGTLLSQQWSSRCLTKLSLWKVSWGLVYRMCLFVWCTYTQRRESQITSMTTVPGGERCWVSGDISSVQIR